ncbi:MAG TPA: hypothetical protein VN253_25140 [Kofleriaceae bacterium]|nr:hypothetical protein [Kofleriaceae bacterium]
MKAICDDPPGPPDTGTLGDRDVDALGRRDREPLHASRKRVLVICLDDEMDVVRLDAHVHDPEILALRCNDRRLAELQVHVAAAQAADISDHTDRDVDWVAPVVRRARLVALARPLAAGWTTGSTTAPAVGPPPHHHLPMYLPRLHHLDILRVTNEKLEFAEIITIKYLIFNCQIGQGQQHDLKYMFRAKEPEQPKTS